MSNYFFAGLNNHIYLQLFIIYSFIEGDSFKEENGKKYEKGAFVATFVVQDICQ